ncbi:hypothetical protein P9112_012274 [Eukaryota sp. TZLM1-RC]
MQAFILKQETKSWLLKNLVQKFGNPKDTFILMGDYGKNGSKNLKHHRPTRGIGWIQFLKRYGFEVLVINDALISAICPVCFEKVGTPLRINNVLLRMKLGLISAVEAEFRPIADAVQSPAISTIASRNFISGILCNRSLVLCKSGIGKVAASITTCILIQEFKCDHILFIGTAGSVNCSVSVGDVVVGSTYAYHDFNCFPIFDKHVVPSVAPAVSPGNIHFHACPVLLKKAITAARLTVSKSTITSALCKLGVSNTPQVHTGLILSGDKFIGDTSTITSILEFEPFSSALAIEMESSGVAQSCFDFGVAFAAVRIISDSACSQASVDWTLFCQDVAGIFGLSFVEQFINLL